MTKRDNEYLLKVFESIVTTVRLSYPQDTVRLEKDFGRVSRLCAARGQSVFLLDFPAAGKVFDKALSDGFISQTIPILGIRSAIKVIPKTFGVLFEKVFDANGILLEQPDINAILYIRQLLLFAKKFGVPCAKTKTFEKVHDFYVRDSLHPDPVLDWNGKLYLEDFEDHMYGSPDPLAEWCDQSTNIRGYVRFVSDLVSLQLGEFVPTDWSFKHGPGAVSDRSRYTNKYEWNDWPARLECAFPFADCGFSSYSTWLESVESSGYAETSYDPDSLLIAVPKDAKGPRLIAAEPSMHQWCQQSILDYLFTRVSETSLSPSIHFGDQRVNGRLALISSRTQSHWTIDLSNASDCVRVALVESVFRLNPTLLHALYASRTRWIRQEIDGNSPKLHKLRMFSTMGSAVTFPVQTLLFAILMVASIMCSRGRPLTKRSVRQVASEISIFGDDIIVPSDAGSTCIRTLVDLGFEVNDSKTYREGRFRESCGVDAYNGYDVTPVYVRQRPDDSRPESIASAVMTANNFWKNGWWHASHTVAESTGWRARKLPIVAVDSGVMGLSSFCGCSIDHLESRWNNDLQSEMVYALRVLTKDVKEPSDDWTALLQYYTERPEPDLDWASGTMRKRPSLLVRGGWVPVADLIGHKGGNG